MDLEKALEKVRWGPYGVQGEISLVNETKRMKLGKYKQGYCKIVILENGQQALEHLHKFTDVRDPDFWGDLANVFKTWEKIN